VAADALNEVVAVLKRHLPLTTAGRSWTQDDIYRILVDASVRASTVESACNELESAPDARTVFFWIKPVESQDLRQLENKLNQMLADRLPPRLNYRPRQVAIDFTLIPYHGKPAQEEEEIRHSRAKSGTTHFHCYATAYIIYKNKRVTVALTMVRADDETLTVLQRLLSRLKGLSIRCKRLYLDRGFYSVQVIRFLQTCSFVTVMPVIRRGKRMKALLKVNQSYRTEYTMTTPKHGSVTFPVWVVCRYLQGRRGKRGIERLGYVVIGDLPWNPRQIRDGYRRRFGIESSYRLMNQVRARTSSREPGRRFLYVAIALLIINLWTYFKWRYLRVGKRVHHRLLSLSKLTRLLNRSVEDIYGLPSSICLQL
jgi:putative transposase